MMNREILFRGKRVDNGEWVYGAFVPDALEMLKGARGLDGFIRRCNAESGEVEMFEVDRETVGQFTGLIDKDGRKIFEGDIIENDLDRFIVEWDDEFAGFFLSDADPEYQGYVTLSEVSKDGCVIGNIYDNPELLEMNADK